jgi:hypothetical protein
VRQWYRCRSRAPLWVRTWLVQLFSPSSGSRWPSSGTTWATMLSRTGNSTFWFSLSASSSPLQQQQSPFLKNKWGVRKVVPLSGGESGTRRLTHAHASSSIFCSFVHSCADGVTTTPLASLLATFSLASAWGGGREATTFTTCAATASSTIQIFRLGGGAGLLFPVLLPCFSFSLLSRVCVCFFNNNKTHAHTHTHMLVYDQFPPHFSHKQPNAQMRTAVS